MNERTRGQVSMKKSTPQTMPKKAVDQPGFAAFELEADTVMSRSRTQRAQWIVRGALLSVAALITWAC